MKFDHNHIDQLFRSKLGSYEVQPPPHVWGNIASRRKGIVVRNYLLLLLLLLLIAGALVFLYSSFDSESGLPAESDFALSDLNPSEKITGDQYLEADFISAPLSDADLIAEQDNPVASLTSNAGDAPPGQNTQQSESLYFAPKKLTSGEFGEFTQTDDLFRGESTLPPTEVTTTHEGELGGLDYNMNLESAAVLESGREIGAKFDRSLSSVSMLFNENFPSEGMINRPFSLQENSNRTLFCLMSRGPECFEPKIRIRYFALDLLAGPDFYHKILTARTDDATNLLNLREGTESFAISYGATVRLSAILHNGLALRTGISVNQINEKFEFVDPNQERRRVVNVLIDTIINAPNDTTFVFDTLSVVETGTRVKKVHNRYQMIDIPILVGYEYRHGDWTFTGSAGIMINLAFSTRGEILSSSGDPVRFPDPETDGRVFKAGLGLSLTGSFGAAYRIDSRYSAMIEPRFIYRLKPLTIDSYPLKQNYFVFGIQAGLRYRFK